MSSNYKMAAIAAALVTTFVAVVGNYHFIYGEDISLRKVPKVSWSLSETLINADEVKATPLGLLRTRFPLFTQAAERAGK